MGQYCFAGSRLTSSVMLPAVRPAARRARDCRRAGGWAADTARRASRVTSRQGDTLFHFILEVRIIGWFKQQNADNIWNEVVL